MSEQTVTESDFPRNWIFDEDGLVADEIARRKEGDLTQGELVSIRRGETKESAGGRSYVSYAVRFPEAPKRSPKEILSEPEPAPESDDVPF